MPVPMPIPHRIRVLRSARRTALAVLMAATAAAAAFDALAAPRGCVPARDGRLVCPPPDGRCVLDRLGAAVCSAEGGGIRLDRLGEPVCGPGRCVTDWKGDVQCSDTPRGAAGIDRYGRAACFGGCVPAQAETCVRPEPAN